jgi:hypothetical protein
VRLRTYQQQAAADLVAVLQKHRVAYLRGEVRVGKTFTALEALKRLGAKSCLIVTKKKAIPSIEADRDAIGLTAIVEVTNFEQVPKRAGRFYDVLVVDEAHSVGAYPKPSKRWHDLRAIRYKHIILMSGTPSPESYSASSTTNLHWRHSLGPTPTSTTGQRLATSPLAPNTLAAASRSMTTPRQTRPASLLTLNP